MSYKLPDSASLEALREYLIGVVAGAEAVPTLSSLVPPLMGMLEKVKVARDARDEARFKLVRASRKVRVLDAVWDNLLGAVSGMAFLISGKSGDKDPYKALFGTVTAKDAQDLGPAKAVAVGDLVISKARAFGNPELTAPINALAAGQGPLNTAATARNAAELELAVHDVERRKLMQEIETLIATSEVGVLTAFPGNRKLVQAILAPERSDRPGKRAADGKPDDDGEDGPG